MAYQSNVMGIELRMLLVPLLVGVVTLTGCQLKNDETATAPAPAVQEAQPKPEPQQTEMNDAQQVKNSFVLQCQKELDALKGINLRVYDQKKAVFDNLINNVAMYRSVRGQINDVTRNTMDALYEFKANQICADIRQAVMQNLIKQGERVQ